MFEDRASAWLPRDATPCNSCSPRTLMRWLPAAWLADGGVTWELQNHCTATSTCRHAASQWSSPRLLSRTRPTQFDDLLNSHQQVAQSSASPEQSLAVGGLIQLQPLLLRC